MLWGLSLQGPASLSSLHKLYYVSSRGVTLKLISFSVSNYRSITVAHKINMKQMTVLVGKNNEGKSNILKALNVAMNSLLEHSQRSSRSRMLITPFNSKRIREDYFYWDRDFPTTLKKRVTASGLESIFKLDFRLNENERMAFKEATGIRGNEDIPITIKIGKDNEPKISVPKRGSSSYTKKSKVVAQFISNNISFNCIQAVRTEKMAIEVLEDILNEELLVLRNNQEYLNALNAIKDLQLDILKKISQKVSDSLYEFLPKLKKVNISLDTEQRRFVLGKEIDIIIDDGSETSISLKGDGVKSLTALAMLKDKYYVKEASIIAIEEPEAHLHPEAIHQLVKVINNLSDTNQIIISTHNPAFVSRNALKANIIVNSGSAKPAKTIKEIRDTLGVLPSDNLTNARFVLVVEGESDKLILSSILSSISLKIKNLISSNSIEIRSLDGSGNLTYTLYNLNSWLCNYFVFVDYDKAGIQAVEAAKNKGLLLDSQVKFCICKGQPESEIEDCLNVNLYRTQIEQAFAVELSKSFRSNRKWSERLKAAFIESGQVWSSENEQKAKTIVAQAVEDKPQIALNEHKRSPIDALLKQLESINIDQ